MFETHSVKTMASWRRPELPAAAPVQHTPRSKAATVTTVVCGAIICLWLLDWLPAAHRGGVLEAFLFWFGGTLNFLLVPAILGFLWGLYSAYEPDETTD